MDIDIFKLRAFPLADELPMMKADELAGLMANIEQNKGLIHAIVLSMVDGELMLIDGRQRRRACEKLGIKPRTKMLPDGTDLKAWVVAASIHGKTVTMSQKAALLARAYPKPTPGRMACATQEVDSGSLSKARTVERTDPAKLDDVLAGKISLQKAYDAVMPPKAKPAAKPATEPATKPAEAKPAAPAKYESFEDKVRAGMVAMERESEKVVAKAVGVGRTGLRNATHVVRLYDNRANLSPDDHDTAVKALTVLNKRGVAPAFALVKSIVVDRTSVSVHAKRFQGVIDATEAMGESYEDVVMVTTSLESKEKTDKIMKKFRKRLKAFNLRRETATTP